MRKRVFWSVVASFAMFAVCVEQNFDKVVTLGLVISAFSLVYIVLKSIQDAIQRRWETVWRIRRKRSIKMLQQQEHTCVIVDLNRMSQ